MALQIVAIYTHGTNRFWVYEHMSDEGIFKFWVPHTRRKVRADGSVWYESQQPPETMDLFVEFERSDDA